MTVATKRKKPAKAKVKMTIGDWVRCILGPLRDAEGTVDKVQQVSKRMAVVEVRQLNGNKIRLPRSHWEFASLRTPREMHA